jgi:hypothetical protein
LTSARAKSAASAPALVMKGRSHENLTAAMAAALLSTIGMPFGPALAEPTGGPQNPCAPPTEISENTDETAWQLS